MSYIYRQLCRDHKHMQQLLDTFEGLLHDLGKGDRDPATLSLILDALDYFSVYPDKWHHPVEDLVFERLLAKPIDDRDAVVATLAEHRSIAAATRKLNSLFYAVANDAAVERNKLTGAASEYLRLQRRHIQKENRVIFPLVEQHLSRADWEHIGAQLKKQSNPLFNSGVKKLYDTLYENLAECGRQKLASA